jgi:hypothetical protein
MDCPYCESSLHRPSECPQHLALQSRIAVTQAQLASNEPSEAKRKMPPAQRQTHYIAYPDKRGFEMQYSPTPNHSSNDFHELTEHRIGAISVRPIGLRKCMRDMEHELRRDINTNRIRSQALERLAKLTK